MALSQFLVVGAVCPSKRRPAVPVDCRGYRRRAGNVSTPFAHRPRGRSLGNALSARRDRERLWDPTSGIPSNVGPHAVEILLRSQDDVMEPGLPVEIGTLQIPPDPF